jgi:hypothetical protein
MASPRTAIVIKAGAFRDGIPHLKSLSGVCLNARKVVADQQALFGSRDTVQNFARTSVAIIAHVC